VRAPDLRVDVPRTIRGRVTDEEGRPVQNAEVDLVKGDGDFGVLNHRATDAQGLFSLDQPLLGPAVLRAAFEGTVGAQVRVGASPGLAEEWVELRVAKASQVGGVVRGDDGRPHAAVRVRCGDTERTTSTGGRFELACPRGSALTFDDGHAARTVAVGAGESLYLEIPL
jgi:hypothetical protein